MKLILTLVWFALASGAFAATPSTCYHKFDASKLIRVSDDANDIADLIYKSQTACHGRERRDAIRSLGEKFNPDKNPEIFSAAVYGLKDDHEMVRFESVSMLRKFIAVDAEKCFPEINAALRAAEADCDQDVAQAAAETRKYCPESCYPGSCK